MKLLFKQRLFSWFDSYDIYDEAGNTVYVVKGQLSWGHKLVIYDAWAKNSHSWRHIIILITMDGILMEQLWNGIIAFLIEAVIQLHGLVKNCFIWRIHMLLMCKIQEMRWTLWCLYLRLMQKNVPGIKKLILLSKKSCWSDLRRT